MLQDYEGEHLGPMRYTVRLAPPDHTEAYLYGPWVDDIPQSRLLCHCPERGKELATAAGALWRHGTHYRSQLTLVWGTFHGSRMPERVQTTTICAAVPAAFAAAMKAMWPTP